MSLYIIVHGVLYYAISFLACSLFVIRHAYPENTWSRMMRQLVFTPSNEAQGRWHLQPPGEALINGYTPYEALLHTLCLILLYTIVLAMILFIFNTCLNKAAGSALAGAVHIVGYMMAFDSFGFDYGRFSLFFNGMFLFVIDTGISLLSSYVLLLLILCILLFIGPGFMRRADFKYSVGGKND